MTDANPPYPTPDAAHTPPRPVGLTPPSPAPTPAAAMPHMPPGAYPSGGYAPGIPGAPYYAPAYPASPYAHGLQRAPHVYPHVRRTNPLAVASFVMGLVGVLPILPFIGSLLAVIFGHIALTQTSKSGDRGRGFAIAGIILGWLIIALAIVLLAFLFPAFVESPASYA